MAFYHLNVGVNGGDDNGGDHEVDNNSFMLVSLGLIHLNYGFNRGGGGDGGAHEADNYSFRFVCPSIKSPKLWFKLMVVVIMVKIMMVVIMRRMQVHLGLCGLT